MYSNPSINSDGYNGYADADISYSESGSEFATLTIDADPSMGVPEPAGMSLMMMGLGARWNQRRRRSPR